MERIILEENNLKDYTIIGRGYESIIYYYAGVVYKIFNKNDSTIGVIFWYKVIY